ncbi:DoxX family protein [Paraflavisolibacter sp. H34]|uniref:DoxX family protein n=1 Tax=Huijunlia imazamoxiresistens TaxID=3127457 RepID=UPI00301AEE3D
MKRIFSTRYSENAVSFAALVLRLVAGSLLLVMHGLDKLMHFIQKSEAFPDPFGIGSSSSLALVVFAEFFCSALVILGLLTRLAAIPIVINMGVALFVAHHGDLFGKGESAGLFFAAFVALLFIGPGKVSIDRMIAK